MAFGVCDKDGPRSRCQSVAGATYCPGCGKRYGRCLNHGGQKGAERSLRAHLTMFPECKERKAASL